MPQLLLQNVSTTTLLSDNVSTVLLLCYTSTTPPYNVLQLLLQDISTTTLLFDNAFTAVLFCYTSITPPYNTSQLLLQDTFITTLLPGNAFTALPPYYIFTTLSYNTPPSLLQNIFKYSFNIYKTSYKIEALEQLVILYFEAKLQKYKPKKTLFIEIIRILKIFNVTSLKDFGKALDEVKIDYKNLDHDIIYLCCLFEK
ncbi:21105_t:CDS:2, partial [Dentiscutata erythropus]